MVASTIAFASSTRPACRYVCARANESQPPESNAFPTVPPTAKTIVSSSAATAVRKTSGGRKTRVPAGASASSSPIVKRAPPRTRAYSSSFPLSSSCGGISCPPASAFHALTPAARKPSTCRTGMRVLPRCDASRPRPARGSRSRRSRGGFPQRVEHDGVDRAVAVHPLLEVLDAGPRVERVVAELRDPFVDLRAQLALEWQPVLARAQPEQQEV